MSQGRYRILLVEDDPDDRLIVKELLDEVELWKPVLVPAATYAEGVRRAADEAFDVAIVDYHLGARRGVEFLAEPEVRTADLPVIVLTGEVGSGPDIAAAEAGAADFLPKAGLDSALLERTIRYTVEERRRRRTEARFRALIENSRDLVTILDADGTIQYSSPALERVLGFEPEQKVGTKALREVHPEDVGRVRRAFAELAGHEARTLRLQYRVGHRDGSWRVFDSVAQDFLDDPSIRGIVVSSRDVTELHETQERLAETVALLRQTFASLEQAVFTVDWPSRRILSCNPAVEGMFGYGADELVGHSMRALHVDEASFREFARRTLPVLRRGEAFRGEFTMRRRDGTLFPTEHTITLLDPAKGLEGGVVKVVRDVTERVRQERQTRFQSELLERVGQPVLAVDDEGRTTYWNRALEELTGWSREEVEGRPIFDMLIAQSDREIGLAAREAARAGKRWSGEIRIRDRSGKELVVQATATPAINPDGSPGGRIATGIDITELRRAEEERRRAAERVQFQASLLGAVGQAVIATDLEGRVTYWNRAAEALYGWSAEEAVGRSVVDLTPSAASPEEAEAILETLRRGETWAGEFEVRRRDGSTFPALVTDAPILDQEGRLVGIIGVSSDLSQHRALEEQLRQAQKMEAVGRLAGGIAHDFNNMLTAIQGHASLLLGELPPASDLRPDIEEILQAGERAAALTRQLLAFSRKQVLEERNVDLAALLRGMEPMLRRLIPASIDFRVNAEQGAHVVRADPGQLNQVVMNLVVNAVDAVDEAGAVRLRVDAVELSADEAEAIPWPVEPGRHARLTVEDTGHGIPPDVMEHVFEPFYTTKAEGSGTGLGLATVYGVVKQTGGHILVESEPGRTVFEVLLPLRNEAPDTATRTAPAPAATEGGTVLIVEDDDAVRRVARRVLERAGYNVLEAANGREAIDLADRRSGPIDVVVSDVVMPDIGGVELRERLSRSHPELRVILTSGYSEAELRGEVRQKGGTFLSKPFTPESLVAAVRDTLRGGAGGEPAREGAEVG